jgi:LIX1-like protein
MRSQISLDWIARETEKPDIINQELDKVNKEIEKSRLMGRELKFLKEKRDILLLAGYQLDMEINIY